MLFKSMFTQVKIFHAIFLKKNYYSFIINSQIISQRKFNVLIDYIDFCILYL